MQPFVQGFPWYTLLHADRFWPHSLIAQPPHFLLLPEPGIGGKQPQVVLRQLLPERVLRIFTQPPALIARFWSL